MRAGSRVVRSVPPPRAGARWRAAPARPPGGAGVCAACDHLARGDDQAEAAGFLDGLPEAWTRFEVYGLGNVPFVQRGEDRSPDAFPQRDLPPFRIPDGELARW